MAGPDGFEPPTAGFEDQDSSTELRTVIWWKTEESNPTHIAAGPCFQDRSLARPAASSSVVVPVTESGAGLWSLRLLQLTHP